MCTGNICRSPTAERLAAAYASRFGLCDLKASSAGTHAVIGHAMHPSAALVLTSLGGDASGFIARQLTPQAATAADLIITMTVAHRDKVLELAPHCLNRTFLLTEASALCSADTVASIPEVGRLRWQLSSAERRDIVDPVGQSLDRFAQVGEEIAEFLLPVLEFCRRNISIDP